MRDRGSQKSEADCVTRRETPPTAGRKGFAKSEALTEFIAKIDGGGLLNRLVRLHGPNHLYVLAAIRPCHVANLHLRTNRKSAGGSAF